MKEPVVAKSRYEFERHGYMTHESELLQLERRKEMGFSLIEAVIAAAIVLILVAIGWGAYSHHQRPTIELKKDEWECVKWEERTYLQQMGGVLMPMTTTVCVEYKRHDDEQNKHNKRN